MNQQTPTMRRWLGMAALLMATLTLGACVKARRIAPGDWPSYGRDPASTRFSPLDQINTTNVGRLSRAWTYHTGDILTGEQQKNKNVFECTPLVIDGVMYLITPLQRVIALDAARGEEVWAFDPEFDPAQSGLLASRGLAYWTDGTAARLFVPVRDGRIVALDPDSGRPIESFGDGGAVDLRKALPGPFPSFWLSSPPAIAGDLLIQGAQVADSFKRQSHLPLFALDVRSGQVVWTFNTVPIEGEMGTDTWANDSWRGRGGANVWSAMSVDTQRGLIFIPVAAPNFDFYGGDRHGQNLFSNSVVALDAATGRRLWHYQTVHHDLWDYDLPAQPALVDLRIKNRSVPAVAQISKTGFVYLLNRLTGKPIFPIEERPVPASDIPGEQTWPTQPFPTRPPAFSKQGLTEKDLSRIDEETRAYVLEKFRTYRNDGFFTPGSARGSIVMPGFHGGGNWSGAAFDPRTGWLYVNSTELVCTLQIYESDDSDFGYRHGGWNRFYDQNGYPANAPPWGLLSAIDLNKGEIVWQKPLGEFDELTARGIPATGQENFGGATVTAGGLVLIASTMDECLRAFDAATGEILFTARLDAAGYAAPVSYEADGRQWIAICAGGGGKLKTPVGDSVIAFALPE